MSDPDVKLDRGGSQPTKPASPQAIREVGRAQNALWRTLLGGGVLLVLCVGYACCLAWRPEQSAAVLAVIGTGLGFLLGQSRGKDQD